MKPILFNTEMVKAILARRKTVTRRLIKPQPHNVLYDGILQQGEIEDGDVLLTLNKDNKTEMLIPPYQAGDALYVRETWCKGSLNGGVEQYFYKADDNDFHCQWRPSIHMPKGAARIFLRVTEVMVERLQDITTQQTIKEGFMGEPCHCFCGCTDCCGSGWLEPPIVGFVETWDSIIKKSDLAKYGWDANPWVWVIEFERISKEEALKNA